MNDERNILILTGSSEVTRDCLAMLKAGGLSGCGGPYADGVIALCLHGGMIPSGISTIIVNPENTLLKMIKEGLSCEIHHHSELTPELVSTFPGARQLPPVGPFEFEGRMWEVDGDEERFPQKGEVFLGKLGGKTTSPVEVWQGAKFDVKGEDERWILRPIITEEMQAAMDHQKQTASVVSEARKANREAMDRVADLRNK